MSDEVIVEATERSEGAETLDEFNKPPNPREHLKELIDGFDNQQLRQTWDQEMKKFSQPIAEAYKKLPVYKRIKVRCESSEQSEFQYGIVAGLHNVEQPEPKVFFTCYCWPLEQDEANEPTIHYYDMDQLDRLVVLNEDEYEAYDKSVPKK